MIYDYWRVPPTTATVGKTTTAADVKLDDRTYVSTSQHGDYRLEEIVVRNGLWGAEASACFGSGSELVTYIVTEFKLVDREKRRLAPYARCRKSVAYLGWITAFRGRGKRFLREVLALLAGRDVRTVILAVDGSHVGSTYGLVRFYKRSGFVRIPRMVAYRLPFMVKKLRGVSS